MVFNSTSENPNSIDATLSSKAALLFEYCNNVTLTSITVNSSDGVGIQMYNTIGTISISHSVFSEKLRRVTLFQVVAEFTASYIYIS